MANEIRDAFRAAFRDYVVQGVPSSGSHRVDKKDVRNLGDVVQAQFQAAAAGNVAAATWSQLVSTPGSRVGQPGQVAANDTGTHTDPVVGGTVPNSGEYRWSGSGWQRTGDVIDADFLSERIEEIDRSDLINETPPTSGIFEDEAGHVAAQYSDDGYETPFLRQDAGFSFEFQVADDKGTEALWVDEGGIKTPFSNVDPGVSTEFQVADDAGNSALLLDGERIEIPGLAEKLPDIVALNAASFREPAGRIVEVGGFLRINRPEQPYSPSPFVTGPATISQDVSNAAYNKRNYQCIPSTCWLPGPTALGRWWTFWFGGYDADTTITPPGEFAGNFGVAAFSDDGGETWTEAFYIVPGPMPLRVADLSVVAIGGRIHIRYWYAKGISGGTKNGGASVSGFVDGCTVGYSFWLNNPLAAQGRFVFSKHRYSEMGLSYNFFEIDGDWHVPMSVYYSQTGDRLSDEIGRWVWRFHPQTSTYERVFSTPFEETVADQDWDERQITQLSTDGRLLCQWRSKAGIYQSIRNGDGVWSAPALWTGILPHAAQTKHYLGRSPTGRLVAVLNKSTTRDRMTVAISEDDGDTWLEEHQVEVFSGESTYPTVAYDQSGNVLITFDAGRGPPSASIRCCRISEEDILSGVAIATVNVISINPNL